MTVILLCGLSPPAARQGVIRVMLILCSYPGTLVFSMVSLSSCLDARTASVHTLCLNYTSMLCVGGGFVHTSFDMIVASLQTILEDLGTTSGHRFRRFLPKDLEDIFA